MLSYYVKPVHIYHTDTDSFPSFCSEMWFCMNERSLTSWTFTMANEISQYL